jgi:PAS domain S-box-containing protein
MAVSDADTSWDALPEECHPGHISHCAAIADLGRLALSGTDFSALLAETASLVARILPAHFCQIIEFQEDGDGFAVLASASDLPSAPADSLPSLRIEIAGTMSEIPWGALEACAIPPRRFSEEDHAFLHAIAYILTTAIERRRTGEQLWDTEQRLQLAAANAPGMVYRFLRHPDGRFSFAFVSEGCREVTGLTPNVFLHDPDRCLALIHGDDRANFQEAITLSAATMQPKSWQGRLVLESGEEKWVQLASRPERQANGDISWDGLLLDITVRKQTEAVRSQLAAIVESSQDAIIGNTLDGIIRSWNPAAERLFGYTAAEAIGSSYDALVPALPAHYYASLTERLRRGEPTSHYEIDRRAKDGRFIPVSVSLAPIRDAEGCTQGISSIVRDITERRRAENISQGLSVALTRTLNALTTDPEPETFLRHVLVTIRDLLDAAYITLWFYDADLDALILRLTCERGQITAPETADTPRLHHAPLWEEMTRIRQPILIEDVPGDPRIAERSRLTDHHVQTLLLVPLLMNQETRGWLSIGCAQRRIYQPDEIVLSQALAQQVTLAVELERLAEQGRHSAVLDERNRMAREIHDTLAQGFTGILLQLEAAEDVLTMDVSAAQGHLTRARELARQSLAEARRSVWALRPQVLEQQTLPAALRTLARQMTHGAAVKAHVHVHGTPRPLPPGVESDLLRIGLEAFTNALRHAQATVVHVDLTFSSHQIRLTIRDDGRGFDPDQAIQAGGMGLTSMRERAARLGAHLELSSHPGHGAEIIIVAPLGKDQEDAS